MSDYLTNIYMTRWDVADMICDGREEHAMWVMANIATRVNPADLHNEIDYIDDDPAEVAKFFRDLANLIDGAASKEGMK